MESNVMKQRSILKLLVTFGFVLAAIPATGAAAAQDSVFGPVPFTVHKANCPVDYEGSIYDSCHANGVEGVSFEVRGFEMATDTMVTDANGEATTMILENMSITSDITLIENSADFNAYLGAYAYCRDQNSGDVLYDGMVEGGSIYFLTLDTGQYVICDWYNFTPAIAEPGGEMEPGDPSTVEPSTGVEVEGLPSTGTGPDSVDGTSPVLMLLYAALSLVGFRLVLAMHRS